MSDSKFMRFLDYVEFRTKITSIFAFLMALAYLYYLRQPVNWKLTGIFFFSMFVFDLTTTAINNYIDTKTNTQVLQFKRPTALVMIYIMFLFSAGAGIYLAWCTDIVVLAVGGICFLSGVFYTYGPVPLSRQPLGEIFAGIFYGLMIPFLMLYINMPAGTYVTLEITSTSFQVTMNIWPVISLLFLSIAPVCVTANLMLSNNLCDLPKDIKVKRYTLPYYLGDKALTLYAWIYHIIFLAAIFMVILKIMPWTYLLLFSVFPFVQKNIRRFQQKQEKKTTFFLSIQNYLLIMGMDVLVIFISGVISR